MTQGRGKVQFGVLSLPILTLAFSSIANYGAPPSLTWRWSNPTPHSNNIIDIASRGQFWIQVAELGQIYTSGDLISWTPRESHTMRSLRAVTFFGDRILIVGETGFVATSHDGIQWQ